MRRTTISLAVLLAVALAGYTGYWFYMAGQLRAGIGPWAEARRAEGYTVRWDAVSVQGYPMAFRLRFDRAAFGSARPVPFDIAGPLLIGETRPWDLKHWRLSAPQGAEVGMPTSGDRLAAATLDGTITTSADDGITVDLTAHGVSGQGAAAGIRITDAEAKVTLPARPPARHTDTAVSAALRLAGLALPQAVPPFGSNVELLTLAATLKGSLPPGQLRQALATWRDDGGTVELEDGSVRWGSLAASANGTIALDQALQPIGALTATIENHNAIVDAAVANGNLRPDDAGFIKAFLGLLAKPGPDGRKRLTVPVNLQNDRVYLGPAQIAALPRFTWE